MVLFGSCAGAVRFPDTVRTDVQPLGGPDVHPAANLRVRSSSPSRRRGECRAQISTPLWQTRYRAIVSTFVDLGGAGLRAPRVSDAPHTMWRDGQPESRMERLIGCPRAASVSRGGQVFFCDAVTGRWTQD